MRPGVTMKEMIYDVTGSIYERQKEFVLSDPIQRHLYIISYHQDWIYEL